MRLLLLLLPLNWMKCRFCSCSSVAIVIAVAHTRDRAPDSSNSARRPSLFHFTLHWQLPQICCCFCWLPAAVCSSQTTTTAAATLNCTSAQFCRPNSAPASTRVERQQQQQNSYYRHSFTSLVSWLHSAIFSLSLSFSVWLHSSLLLCTVCTGRDWQSFGDELLLLLLSDDLNKKRIEQQQQNYIVVTNSWWRTFAFLHSVYCCVLSECGQTNDCCCSCCCWRMDEFFSVLYYSVESILSFFFHFIPYWLAPHSQSVSHHTMLLIELFAMFIFSSEEQSLDGNKRWRKFF